MNQNRERIKIKQEVPEDAGCSNNIAVPSTSNGPRPANANIQHLKPLHVVFEADSWYAHKLEAFKSLKFMDCIIRVGRENQIKEIACIKALMCMASPVIDEGFKRKSILQPGTKMPSLLMRNLDPKFFTMVVEFVHLSNIISPLAIEDVGQVLWLAGWLRIQPLMDYCKDIILNNLNADNLWLFLNSMLETEWLKDSAGDCFKEFLCRNTRQCIEHPNFMRASEASVIFMLQQETLHLKSEKQLIDQCARWAKQFPNSSLMKSNFIEFGTKLRNLLPFLRLLTLEPAEVAQLPDFLTEAEKLAVLVNVATKGQEVVSNPHPLPQNISLALQPRLNSADSPEHFFPLISRSVIQAPASCLPPDMRFRNSLSNLTNVVILNIKKNISLTKVHFFHAIKDFAKVEMDEKLATLVQCQKLKYKAKFCLEITKNNRRCLLQTSQPQEVECNSKEHLALSNPVQMTAGCVCKLKLIVSNDAAPLTFRLIGHKFTSKSEEDGPFEDVQFSLKQRDPIVIYGISYTNDN